jgi:hypothetical protein
MKLARITAILAFVLGVQARAFAADTPITTDPRLIGSWKFNNGIGVVLFHTSFANGDFERSVYINDRCQVSAKGRWSSDGKVFHIVILKRITPANSDQYENVEQHFDQDIVQIGENSYTVREPDAKGDGLITWTRLVDSVHSKTKSDSPNQSRDPTP